AGPAPNPVAGLPVVPGVVDAGRPHHRRRPPLHPVDLHQALKHLSKIYLSACLLQLATSLTQRSPDLSGFLQFPRFLYDVFLDVPRHGFVLGEASTMDAATLGDGSERGGVTV